MGNYLEIDAENYADKRLALEAAGAVLINEFTMDHGLTEHTYACLSEGDFSKIEIFADRSSAIDANLVEQRSGCIQSSAWAIPSVALLGNAPYLHLRPV